MEEPTNEDVARACRHEAGRILADLTALDAEQGELLEEGLPHAFGADWQAVANVIGQGRADLAAWFDLATSRPGKLVVQGREDDTDEITVMTDIVAGRLRRQVDGSLSWEAQIILRAGEKAMGRVVRHGEQPSHAQVYVPGQGLEPGGVVCLEAGEFTTPPPVRHAKPPGCGGR